MECSCRWMDVFDYLAAGAGAISGIDGTCTQGDISVVPATAEGRLSRGKRRQGTATNAIGARDLPPGFVSSGASRHIGPYIGRYAWRREDVP